MNGQYDSAIVHISDIECGPNNRAELGSVKGVDDPYKMAVEDLVKDINQVTDEHHIGQEHVGVVITGDIVHSGGKDEWEKAVKVVDELVNRLQVTQDMIAIVPGNHDVDKHVCKELREQQLKEKRKVDESAIQQLPGRLLSFGKFFKRFCGHQFQIGTPVSFPGFKKLGIAMIGLDSTLECTDESRHGFLSYSQIKKAGDKVRQFLARDENLIAVAATHHSLFPATAERGPSSMKNAEQAAGWLAAQGFSAVLCGHQHEDKEVAYHGGKIEIVVAGSYGVDVKSMEKSHSSSMNANRYQVILVNAKERKALVCCRILHPHEDAPMGVWNFDNFKANPFPELRFRGPKTSSTIALHVAPPIAVESTAGKKEYVIGVGIQGEVHGKNRVVSVEYQIQGTQEKKNGDKECGFIADITTGRAKGRKIIAVVTRAGGEACTLEKDIPA